MSSVFDPKYFKSKCILLLLRELNMSENNPLILITNDDGIDASGLHQLAECVSSLGDIYIVAPQSSQSGKSAAMTVSTPLRVSERESGIQGIRAFVVNGTPVDCVKLAIHAIVPRRPAIVLSGINHGSNSGVNIIYSGTMGATFEGCIEGIPSVGFSLIDDSYNADFSLSINFIKDIVIKILSNGLPHGICLNVNIPAHVIPKGIRVCRAVKGKWIDGYRKVIDSNGDSLYLLTGKFVNFEPSSTDTDEFWLAQNYISIVPVECDKSAKTLISAMSQIYDSN